VKHLIEFPLDNGDFIVVEVDEPPAPTDDRIGIGDDVARKAKQSFESAMAKIKPVADTIIQKVKSLNEPADEVEVKFGLKMSGELGAVVASGKADVNYEITLKWKK
jgi:Trypsin-co-occurring domain 1